MANRIPLNPNPDQRFSVRLEDVSYSFRVMWNTRDNSYRLNISQANNEPIVSGLKLLPTQNLLRNYTNPLLPTGLLMVIDTSGKNNKPEYEDLGDTLQLVYFTEAEANELFA